MYITLLIFLSLFIALIIFLNQPKFGKVPGGERLKRIKASPNFKNGAFQNQSITPQLTEGTNIISIFLKFFFQKKERNKPVGIIPSIKTDLFSLDKQKNVLVWFGHSSYFMQLDGKSFLVDPVLSGHASPLSFGTSAFKGADIYKPDDMPSIDCLFLTHDHWDHLDYDSLVKLKPKIKKIVCALGVGEHLEYWSFSKNMITEMDWNEETILENGFIVNAVPARHFSGRGLKRNQSLWTSFVLQTPSKKIFVGGDSGYDKHFELAGKTFGPFDLAILENGQYNKDWKYIHLMPNEVLMAAKDLHAKKLLPVHSSKFAISLHAWDEPLSKITDLNQQSGLHLLTPMIGQVVDLDDDQQNFAHWWEGVD
jgi:L-ascorbate metabolism protein UlaG (beta-lactamase superfamily)